MRTIKFRGKKRVDNGEWAYTFIKYDTWDEGGVTHQVVPETIGQFTGCCDKNGKEFYEGGVVETPWGIYISGHNGIMSAGDSKANYKDTQKPIVWENEDE